MRGLAGVQVSRGPLPCSLPCPLQPPLPPTSCPLCRDPTPCSTCHVVLSKEYYQKTVSDGEPSDEENDLLDLA